MAEATFFKPMWKMLTALAALFTLAACNPSAPDPDAAAKLGEAAELPRELPNASVLPAATPRYVGLWATADAMCPEAPWTIRQDGISTRGEVSCIFNSVRETASGYEAQATCQAQAPPQNYTIQLAFAESAQALLITGGPWEGQTGLVYCGPLPSQS